MHLLPDSALPLVANSIIGYEIKPNRPLGCYAPIKPFCHQFRNFSVTMEAHYALKMIKRLSKIKAIITITLITD